jgi:hypothetical protein
MLKLRGHHLICLHFFNGEGYDQTFIDNLRDTLKTLLSEELEIVAGGDNVCRECPYLKDESCQYHNNADAEIREMDRKALELLGFAVGNSVSWDRIRNSIPKIFPEWFRSCCTDCEWLLVCEKNHDFRKVRPDDP